MATWSGKLEVSYWVGREFWGQGIAIASLRVLEKCGFAIAGYERGFADGRGEEVEEVVLELKPEV